VTGPTTYPLTVNGRPVEVQADDDTTLLHVLRHDLGLAGPRFGCGVGLCGACFVLLDGNAAPACDTPMWAAAGKDVVTVEGLADGAVLHPVQQAFLDEQAAQCGFCVSGILVSAAALLAGNPQPDEPAVVAALDRNLCRCGAQRRMVAAVLRAADGRPPDGTGVQP
jgi:nicotinate dehydrogenase subunit A